MKKSFKDLAVFSVLSFIILAFVSVAPPYLTDIDIERIFRTLSDPKTVELTDKLYSDWGNDIDNRAVAKDSVIQLAQESVVLGAVQSAAEGVTTVVNTSEAATILVNVDSVPTLITNTLVELPSAANAKTGQSVYVKFNKIEIDAVVNIAVNTGGNIDGETTVTVKDIHDYGAFRFLWDGSEYKLIGKSVEENEGVVKINGAATGFGPYNLVAGVEQQIILTFPLTVSTSTDWPGTVSRNGDHIAADTDFYDTATDKFLENPENLQSHLWRIRATFANRTTVNQVETVTLIIRNPISGFEVETTDVLIKAVPSGNLTFFGMLTIADGNSIGVGYQMIWNCSDDVDVTIVDITRESLHKD